MEHEQRLQQQQGSDHDRDRRGRSADCPTPKVEDERQAEGGEGEHDVTGHRIAADKVLAGDEDKRQPEQELGGEAERIHRR
jgi:hypothetical protein